jgi:parallel beta-helix repeat protein/predicted outer membrane repeat protein
MKLKEQEVPTGLSTQSGERNISYDFKAVSDADGNGSTWRTSEESIECFTSTPLSINTNFMLNDNNPQLIQIEITDTATEIKVASGTAVEVVLSNIESADGSNQEYRIYDSSADSMEGRTELTEPATLVVFSERGETYQEEYAIAINLTPFVKLDSVSENFQSLKRLNRPESNYSETWHNSIAIAVASANNSEPSTITVWPATYPEDEMEIVGKQLAIKSIDENSFTIDLEGKECRAFNITSTATVMIQNAIIQNGQPTDGQGGGAIRLDNSKLHIENSTITNNITPLYGGALSVENESVLTMIGCSLFGNKATADSDSDQMGGSIFLEKGYFYATNTTVENNEAGRYGGGIYLNLNGECILENCTITNNKADRLAGGIYISAPSPEDFIFIGKKLNVTYNHSDNGGGILISGDFNFSLYESIISNNTATTSGGGVFAGSTGLISGCTINSNQSLEHGGGIYVNGDNLTVVDSFIFENRADRNGGGIYFYWAEGTINETIIRANNADNGSGVYIVKSYDSTKDIVTENINWINDIGSQLENIGIAPKESNGAVNYATGVVYEENILNDYSVVITDNSTDTGNNQLHIEQ